MQPGKPRLHELAYDGEVGKTGRGWQRCQGAAGVPTLGHWAETLVQTTSCRWALLGQV